MLVTQRWKLALSLVLAVSILPAQEERQLDVDIRLFTVMAAINVAGYDDGINSTAGSPVREALRKDLEDFDGSTLPLLRNFYNQFKGDESEATLQQYISYALLATQPPELELKADLPTDLPPDVRRLRPFSRILTEFYGQAKIEYLFNKYLPAYQQMMESYQAPLADALFEASTYLRFSPTGPEMRQFKVFFDLLSEPGAISTRSYSGRMYVVVHPSSRPRIDEIRHAFLLHLLDRFSIRHGEELAKKEILGRYAMFAPALEQTYKQNFQLLTTKCLVKAVEIRLDERDDAKRASRADRELRLGYILTPYFNDKLAEFEKQGQEWKRFYPQMVKDLNPRAEAARLEGVEFVEAPPKPVARVAKVEPKLGAGDALFRSAEFELRAGKLGEARKQFEAAQEKYPARRAEAAYGLARVAVFEADPDLARAEFDRALRSDPDTYVRGMCHIYLGRIDDIMGNRDEAIAQYQLALESGDPSDMIRDLAEKGIAEPFDPSRPPSESEAEAQR